MPMDEASTTPNTAAVAIAASTALPPLMRMCTPAKVASGWLEATMPFFAIMENSFVIDSCRDVRRALDDWRRLARFENLRVELGRLVEILHFLGMHHVTLVAAKQSCRFGFDVAPRWDPLEVPEFFLAFFRKREIDKQLRRVR